jgi:hypothetical protein
MKKLVALAVAGAFVAPVYAADVSLSGGIAFQYRASDSANTFANDGTTLGISAKSQTANGLDVSAGFTYKLGAEDGDGGEHIAVSSDFGKLSVGDVSGALDSVGDYTDVAPEKGGFDGDGTDAALLYQNTIGGIKVALSHSPEANSTPGGITDDFNAFAVAMPIGQAEIYFGMEDHTNNNLDMSAYGVKVTMSGLMVALEAADIKATTATAAKSITGLALKYTLGDVTLGVERQQTKAVSGAKNEDETTMFASYNLGGGLSVYAESYNGSGVNDSSSATTATPQTDQNTLGISYKF